MWKEKGEARGPSGSETFKRSLADATYSGPITQDIAQKAEIPPEAVGLMNLIAKGEGPNYNNLYNGSTFSDFSAHPADLGWKGDIGRDTGKPTHAAGAWSFQPDSWHDAQKALGLADFSQVPQAKASWWLAQRDYKNNTGRDLLSDLRDHHLDEIIPGLKTTWTSLGKGSESDQTMYGNQSWGRGMADEFLRQGERDARRIEADRAEYLAAAEKAPAGSAERMEMLHEAHDASRRATEQYDKLLKSPTVYQPTDAFAGFGGIIMALAAFAGGRAAQPLTGALTAMSGALDGMNQGNKEAYDRAFHIWDMQTDGALKLVNIQNNEIRNILEDQRMADNEKAAHLQTLFAGYQMDQSAAALREGNWMKVWQMHESSENLAKQARFHADDIKRYDEDRKSREKIAADRQTSDEQRDLFSDLQIARATGDPDQIKAAEQAVEDFNAVHGKGVGQARSAPAMFMQQFKKENPQATSSELADAMGEYRRVQSLEGGFASGVLGRQVVSLNTVADHLSLAREYFAALNNGQIPRANQIANRIAVELGKPEVTNFRAGRDIMADEVVRLLTTTGGTEADREGMQSRLADFFSPEQGKGVLQVLDRFVAGRFNALQQQYAQGDPKRQEYFRNNLLTDKSRQIFGDVGGSGDAGGADYSAPGRPKPGTVEDGFVFQGGDPKDPKSWKPQ
jgi:muramidase (phage lysozyme)